MTSDQTTITK